MQNSVKATCTLFPTERIQTGCLLSLPHIRQCSRIYCAPIGPETLEWSARNLLNEWVNESVNILGGRGEDEIWDVDHLKWIWTKREHTKGAGLLLCLKPGESSHNLDTVSLKYFSSSCSGPAGWTAWNPLSWMNRYTGSERYSIDCLWFNRVGVCPICNT